MFDFRRNPGDWGWATLQHLHLAHVGALAARLNLCISRFSIDSQNLFANQTMGLACVSEDAYARGKRSQSSVFMRVAALSTVMRSQEQRAPLYFFLIFTSRSTEGSQQQNVPQLDGSASHGYVRIKAVTGASMISGRS